MSVTDPDAVVKERQARTAADQAYAAARVAFASKTKADALKAGDLFRYASALYEQAAAAWKARGRKTFAEHCAKMAGRLASSMFAKSSLAATYAPIDPAAE